MGPEMVLVRVLQRDLGWVLRWFRLDFRDG